LLIGAHTWLLLSKDKADRRGRRAYDSFVKRALTGQQEPELATRIANDDMDMDFSILTRLFKAMR
jgi:hypothetical protein